VGRSRCPVVTMTDGHCRDSCSDESKEMRRFRLKRKKRQFTPAKAQQATLQMIYHKGSRFPKRQDGHGGVLTC
jgi:hypothetical protein